MRSTTYWVEVLEKGKVLKVPHNMKLKWTDFVIKKAATDFLKSVREQNPKIKFRLAKKVEVLKHYDWNETN